MGWASNGLYSEEEYSSIPSISTLNLSDVARAYVANDTSTEPPSGLVTSKSQVRETRRPGGGFTNSSQPAFACHFASSLSH